MTLNRDQLFTDLEALTLEQIEAGLAAGVLGRSCAVHGRALRPETEVAAQQAANVAMDQAASAKLWVTAAFIIAAGAMVAAMAAGLIAFLAVRGFSVNTLW